MHGYAADTPVRRKEKQRRARDETLAEQDEGEDLAARARGLQSQLMLAARR